MNLCNSYINHEFIFEFVCRLFVKSYETTPLSFTYICEELSGASLLKPQMLTVYIYIYIYIYMCVYGDVHVRLSCFRETGETKIFYMKLHRKTP